MGPIRKRKQEGFFVRFLTLEDDCPETSVINYHHSLRNNPEERFSRLLRYGSLKSRIMK